MNRLFKEGMLTTTIGTFFIIVSVIMFYSNKASLIDITGWLTLGLTFLRAKDSLIGIDDKK